jgi:hypothetical protein
MRKAPATWETVAPRLTTLPEQEAHAIDVQPQQPLATDKEPLIEACAESSALVLPTRSLVLAAAVLPLATAVVAALASFALQSILLALLLPAVALNSLWINSAAPTPPDEAGPDRSWLCLRSPTRIAGFQVLPEQLAKMLQLLVGVAASIQI